MVKVGLAAAARRIAKHGRGDDTVLAHITPEEQRMMDHLQGGRVTNPKTGLAEYGLFGDIFKTLLKVGLTVGGAALTGGGSLAAEIGAAGATGLGAAAGSTLGGLATGEKLGDALKGGAISGLTAGVATGLTAPGAAASGAAPPVTPGMSPIPAGVSAATPVTAATAAPLSSLPGSGAGVAASSPGMLGKSLDFLKSTPGKWTAGVTGLESMMQTPQTPVPAWAQQGASAQAAYDPYSYPSWLGAMKQKPGLSQPNLLDQSQTAQGYAAGGAVPSWIPTPHPQGAVPMAPSGMPNRVNLMTSQMGMPSAPAANRPMPSWMPVLHRVNGGDVNGPGDGKSDDIPAMLSDGEHVIAAADVSSLGNGSNAAGQKKLEEFKQMIRRKAGQKNIKQPTPKIRSLASVTKGIV